MHHFFGASCDRIDSINNSFDLKENPMKISEEIRYVRSDRRCICACRGEGFLSFITCPSCRFTTVVCDEIGTVFLNPLDLDEGQEDGPFLSWLDLDDHRCPKCGNALIKDFVFSDKEIILALGFSENQIDILPI
jgi:hypothetical protein